MNKDSGDKPSFIQKLISFVKKNPALAGTLVTVLFYTFIILIGIAVVMLIVYTIVNAFSLLFGLQISSFTQDEKYKNMSLSELQEEMNNEEFNLNSCYKAMVDGDGNQISGWDAFWTRVGEGLTSDIDSPCEYLKIINATIKTVEKKYSDYTLDLDSSMIVSAITYAYSYDPNTYDSEVSPSIKEPYDVLAKIAADKIITKAELKQMVENMVMVMDYDYYECNTEECEHEINTTEEDGSSTIETFTRDGYRCYKKHYDNVYYDLTKFQIFLRYGEEVAKAYELAQNHNSSVLYTCDTCYEKFNNGEKFNTNTFDITKYLVTADPETDTKDNISIVLTEEEVEDFGGTYSTSKSYNYTDGFIYNTFPHFKEAFESNIITESEIYTPKTIEQTIISATDYEEIVNESVDEGEESGISSGKTSIKNTSELVCDTPANITEAKDLSCGCSNGGYTPNQSYSSNSSAGTVGGVCKILIGSEAKIRLMTCTSECDDCKERLPGGLNYELVNGTYRYVASQTISLEQYIKGIAVKEISGTNSKYSVEAVKFQMLIAQTYLLRAIQKGSVVQNSNGEYMVKSGECFQSYKENAYQKSYVNGTSAARSKLDTAYNAIKDKVLIDSSTGGVVFSEYGSKLQNAIAGMNNLTYEQILNSNYIRTYHKGSGVMHYANAEIKTCTEDDLTNSEIVDIALSYVGKDTKRDCSGFARMVLREAGYSDSYTGKSCGGESRRSHGMNYQLTQANMIVWKRSSGSSISLAMSTFPGNCSPGDLIFYTKGNNDCVRHVAIYVGNIDGKDMIVDTTIANHVANYRAVDSIGNGWIPFTCATPFP